MYTGMLWFDNNDKLDLSARIKQAVDYYQKKYGHRPNLCFVHPTTMAAYSNGNGKNGLNVEIRATPYVQPNHFWIGISDEGSAS